MKEVVCFRTSPDTKEKLLVRVNPESNLSELLNDLVLKFLIEEDNPIPPDKISLMIHRSVFLRRRVFMMHQILIKIKTKDTITDEGIKELIQLIKDTYTDQKQFNYKAP